LLFCSRAPSTRMVFICLSRLWPTIYVSVNRMFHLFTFSIRLSAARWVREEQGRRRHFNPPVLAAVSDWYRPLQRWWVQTVSDVLHSLVSTNTHGGTVKTKSNISFIMFTSAWMRVLKVTAQISLIFKWPWVQVFVRLVTLTGILRVFFIWSSRVGNLVIISTLHEWFHLAVWFNDNIPSYMKSVVQITWLNSLKIKQFFSYGDKYQSDRPLSVPWMPLWM
jgi:hypothetical protein